MRVYIDTNILVDLVLSRQEFLPDAQRVFALGYADEAQLMVSALSFINTVYLYITGTVPLIDDNPFKGLLHTSWSPFTPPRHYIRLDYYKKR